MPARPSFAPVGPLMALRRLAEADLFDGYHLLIAPMIIKQMSAFRHFFTEDYPGQTIIVDNGVVELGYPLEPVQLYQAVRTVGATVVVVPDTIDDGKMTVKQARVAIPAYRQLDPETKLLGVAQGKTLEECIACARALVEEGVDWLAASKYSTVNLGSRINLVEALGEFGLPIHVLGFSDNLMDDVLAATAHPMVQGIDSGMPVWAPKQLPAVPPNDEPLALNMGARPRSFWTEPSARNAVTNVATVHFWLDEAVRNRSEMLRFYQQGDEFTRL